jgi:chitodextrinase
VSNRIRRGLKQDIDGAVANHQWDSGDGAVGCGLIVSHAFAAADTCTVTLMVTDSHGGTGLALHLVTVPPE